MNELFERSILWILLSFLLFNFHADINLTAYILVGFIFSCLGIFMEYRYFNFILSVSFAVLTLFFPFAGIFSGIVWYQILLRRDTRMYYETAALSLSVFLFLFHTCKNYMSQDILFLLVTALSIYMAVTLRELESLKEQAIHTRDAHFEKQELLKNQYRMLQEKQDNEIQVATLSERNRIAREIHDNVGHTLSRSILQLGALMAVHRNTDMERQLLPLKQSLDDAMTSIRNSVHNLHRESIDFQASVNRLASEMNEYKILFSCDLSENIPAEVAYSFIAVIKEALTNINRHSDADAVKITARELSNYYQLIIEDNGHEEFDVHGAKTGIGLKNMEDRIQGLKGLIYFSYQNGFRIFISVPKISVEEEMK